MVVVERSNGVVALERWPVKRSSGGFVGLGAAALLLLLGGLALVWAVGQPLGPAVLVAVGLGGLGIGLGAALARLAVGYFRLRYELAPGKLVVHWAGPPETILLDEIDGILAGQRIGPLRRVRGVSWPGYHVGLVRNRALGTLKVFCTDHVVESLSVVTTASRRVVLSPTDPAAFRRELIRRIEAGEAPIPDARPARRWWAPSWPDPLVVGLLAAALALLATSALALLAAYPGLPEMLALQLDASGQPAALSPKGAVFDLPWLGAGLLAANLAITAALRGRERAAGALLCGTSCVVEAVILLATLRVLA